MTDKRKNMYGEAVFAPSTPDTENIPESPGITTNSIEVQSTVPDTAIYLDLDRKLTLGRCIKKIRKMANRLSDDTVIILFFVQGVPKTCPWLYMLWDYLVDTGRQYNVVFRGSLPDTRCFDVKYSTTFDISLNRTIQPTYDLPSGSNSNSVKFIDRLTELGYKFELI